jgi:hypothetical protein
MFNPFDKPIGDQITNDDLKRLLGSVAEGYVVEYKADFPSTTKIGHSLASLANSYGGWYIVGIETDSSHVASVILGYDTTVHPDGVAKIREIAKTHIDPIPAFYPQIVKLEPGRAVLVVYVPSEQETPFITHDGRIYRRIHDSSTPVPETERFAIDRLIDQGRLGRQRFRRFCQDDRTFSQGEADQGWLKLYLSPYPQGIHKEGGFLTTAGMDELLALSKSTFEIPFLETTTVSGNIPFNVVQTTSRSLVLRQVEPMRIGYNSLTAEFFLDGRAKFYIPLPAYNRVPDSTVIKSFEVRQALDQITTKDYSSDTALLRFFNAGGLTLQLAVLVTFYKEWLGKLPPSARMEFAATLEGVWRAVPFFDADDWGRRVQQWESDTPEWLVISGLLYLGFGMPPEFYSSSLAHAMMSAQQQKD